jgi:very-short-patch-repair endonuclease
VEGAVRELAERQHGVVARRQLLEMGCGAGWIEKRVRRGLLLRLHQGVYALGHRVLSRDARWLAAVLACGDGALLSHRSAAQLWLISPNRSIEPEIARSGHFRGQAGIRAHRTAIADDEWTVEGGIPVTSPLRTIFDLAAVVGRRQLERAWHEAEVRGLRDRVSLPTLLERYPRRRGTRALRGLLASTEPVRFTRNDFEEAFAVLIDAHGLPRPRMNADLALRGRFFQVDALWEPQRVVLELDGRAVHGTARNFESDRERDRTLMAEGWRTLRVTWRQLRDEPDSVAGDLRSTLFPDG